jgi:hypothetical protein
LFSANGQFVHLFSSWQGMTNEQLESRFGEGDHDATRRNLQREMAKARDQLGAPTCTPPLGQRRQRLML